jgi:hypothetical protein
MSTDGIRDWHLELPAQSLKDVYTTGLVVTSYNRPAYLKRTLLSLQRSQLDDVILLLVDDGSDDEETLGLLRAFTHPHCPVLKAYRAAETTPRIHENLQLGWDYLRQEFRCANLVNLDGDTVMHRHWLTALKRLHEANMPRYGQLVVTGFNAFEHPVVEMSADHYRKCSIGGINLFFSAELYQQVVRPALVDLQWDWKLVATMQERDYALLCTRPSVIQHIGREGIWSHPKVRFDYALDYWGSNPLVTECVRWLYRARRRLARWGW